MLDTMGVDEATSLFLRSKARMTVQTALCQQSFFTKIPDTWSQLDVATISGFLADLAEFGEIEAIRRSAIRQFEIDPEEFEQDPVLCDQLMNLESEEMGIALGRLDPKTLK